MNTSRPTVVLVGLGAVGSLLAAKLMRGSAQHPGQQPGQHSGQHPGQSNPTAAPSSAPRVLCWQRSESAARELTEQGFEVQDWSHSDARRHGVERFHPEALFEASQLPSVVDLVIVAVKASQLDSVLEAIQAWPKSLQSVPVMLIQNGLLGPERLQQELPGRLLLGVSTTLAARRLSPKPDCRRRVRVVHDAALHVALIEAPSYEDPSYEGPSYEDRPHKDKPVAASFVKDQRALLPIWAERLCSWGIPSKAETSLASMLWRKAFVNAGINALTALLLLPNGALLESAAARSLADEAAREAVDTARALGVPDFQDSQACEQARRLWRQVALETARNGSSSLQDVMARRPTEVFAINAVIASKGRMVGVSTPVNDVLSRLLEAREQTYSTSSAFVAVEWARTDRR